MNDETSFLTKDQAIIFFDWLSRFTESEAFDELPEHERRVLWDIEAELETSLPEVVSGTYKEMLAAASARVAGPDE